MNRKVIAIKGKSKHEVEGALKIANKMDLRVELIQALIPLGLEAVKEMLNQEVLQLAGDRYQRERSTPGYVRWGQQKSSVYLADQKLSVMVPRVRDRLANKEISLRSLESFQAPRSLDEGLFLKVRFADDEMVIAVGITVEGTKVILGFVQTATENEKACSDFLRELVERGLRYEDGILVIIDGSKGLRKAVGCVFGNKALVHRCQWHKRENVVSYLPKREQVTMRRKLQAAYEQPTYDAAKESLLKLKGALQLMNLSAMKSLEEGFEETLTLHRLGLFKELGTSLKTTNLIESINAGLGQRTDKVDCWRNSDQKQRWVASSLLDQERRLRRIRGYRHLPQLKAALKMIVDKKELQKLGKAA